MDTPKGDIEGMFYTCGVEGISEPEFDNEFSVGTGRGSPEPAIKEIESGGMKPKMLWQLENI